MLLDEGRDGKSAEALADLYCRRARSRIRHLFRELFRNDDTATYRVAQSLMKGDFAWLEKGVVPLDEYEVPSVV
ncbi:MAG: hypothetical protein OEZ65_17040, partial [Gemmatimonadota bacterium]|nr:hypothetical protein [Gemmatimonadota bacterium]